MPRYGMAVDISKCTACYCCFAACKDEYWENDYPPYTTGQPRFGQFWMNVLKNERGEHPYTKVACMPLPCMQCEDASCIKAAKNKAVYRRPDGIVVIDPEKAVGQKQLADKKACPYGAIFWNEEKNLAQKCTFCVHRLEEGKLPRCVQACPSECIKFGDLDDPKSEISQYLKSVKSETLHPEYGTDPKVYYVDLYKMNKLFITGPVIFGDTDECAEGVQVTLNGGAKPVKTSTNNYGIFEFDALDSGTYSLQFSKAGYEPATLEVKLKTNHIIGDIVLKKLKK
jgi:Fe-S-cluster-containing dehydrogenase component